MMIACSAKAAADGWCRELITYQGDIQRTVCPFCTETYEDFTPEFPRVLLWILGILFVLCTVGANLSR